jgi:surface polysaccharide O-acyltransferase-like enzyme
VANAIDSSVRWSVPVFVMISGALALDPARGVQPRAFLLKRWYRIGIPLIFWTIFYVWFKLYILGGKDDGWDPVAAIASGSPFIQLYFLYVLAGLVLLTPMLRLLSAHGSRRLQFGTAAIFLGLGVADQMLMYFFGVGSPNMVTRFLPMVGYYIIGWCLRDVVLGRRGVLITVALWILSVASTALIAGLGTGEKPWRYIYDYLSPTVVLASICAFLLLHRFGQRRSPVLEKFAPLSFGVFLVHAVFVFGVRLYIGTPGSPLGVIAHAFGLTLVYALAAAGITWLALKVPYLRAVFGASRPSR